MSVLGLNSTNLTTTWTMSGTATPAGDGTASRPPRHSRRGYRGRYSRNNANRQAQAQTQTRPSDAQLQPQSQSQSQPLDQALPQIPPPTPQTQTQQSDTTTPNTSSGRQRSRRGPRGGRRGGREGTTTATVDTRTRGGGDQHPQSARRSFEGRLTKPHQNSDDDTQEGLEDTGDQEQGLRADAPVFVPGGAQPGGEDSAATAPLPAKGRTRAKNPRTRPPKITTKSEAEDITTRIHEDIAHNLYECPICTGEIGRKSRVWSCGLCWTVFHLTCVKKWSKNEGAAAQDAARRLGEDGGAGGPRAWRCPGCNLAQEIFPSSYTCWCEKEVDPRPLPGLPPHSCGQTCSRKRKGCPHPCDATCHAGPCSPCTAMGPTQDCFCGRNSSTKRCQDTDYERGWSCGEVCGDLLPCGEHTCSRPCHEGLCGACEVKIDARCYCGKVETEMLCSSKDEELESELLHDTDEVEEWTGCFSCGDICNRPFDCAVHSCQKSCHPQDAEAAHCPRSPDVVSHCPCGKTLLADIPGYTPRVSCEDPILNCLEACGKTLPCGHACERVCHTGPCGSCMQIVSIECRCGRNTFRTMCHQGTVEPPYCFRVCKAGLHCGRHSCMERCCPGEQKAIERQATRRKLRSHLRPSDEDVEAEHICTRVCGRTLKCGRHTCPEICHKGPCNTCREAIFEEIPCTCGRSILHPPLPCGTQPPPCSFPCERLKPCGHPQTLHNCHTDEESCPKCPYLTEKTCLCGKRTLKNQPCWLADARCGQICGEPLKCGSHFCQKNCHRPGECEDASQPCQQACGKTKTLCGHPCTEPCHAPYPCSEKAPCASTITVTCSCGRLRQERRCNAAKAVASKGQLQQPQRLPAVSPLTCDDECARLERNRSLAAALGVDINPSTTIAQSALSSTNLPYSSETLDMYVQLSASSPLATLQSYEATLHSLATNATQRSVRTQPAKSSLRAFIHSLAADYGFSSESFDPEPHRHVFVLKPTTWTPPVFGLGNSVSIGIAGMSVGECVKLRERHRVKEREAQRVAAAEAKAQREAAKAQALGSSDSGGWAQVAASKRSNGVSSASAPPSRAPSALSVSGSLYAALAVDDGGGSSYRKEKLVLRSGVGAAKQVRPVADNWEEEEEMEEEEMEEEVEQVGNSQRPGREAEASPSAGMQGAEVHSA
ncbi:putative NF-X1 finger transcription factor [Aspergillus lucknowensis]|uniref:R3H domain-containing protein n=1 Tax=Aspergillus lucknowensis TaxID=176173 RepID=A0ABR4L9K6_9EURO